MKDPRRVLVVEDEKDISDGLRELLEIGEGFEVQTASDGTQALALLQRGHQPDVIVMDLRMPEMSGEHLLGQLGKMGSLKKVPIIIVSADNRALEKQAAKRKYICFKKPFDATELLNAIRQACES